MLKLEASQYDVVTLSGGFVPGHLPSSALHDLVRLCKPGGIVIVVMRYEYLSICPEYQVYSFIVVSFPFLVLFFTLSSQNSSIRQF